MSKKYTLIPSSGLSLALLATLAGALGAQAQTPIDAYRLTQPDLKGTARFMSMGGAFGALGGDLSSLSQNPAGIGVYRSSEIGFTLDLDAQSTNSKAYGANNSLSNTHFYLNNIGGVLTLRLPSQSVPNLNFGFTYNKSSSFNRRYGGGIGRLANSVTNYIAGLSNSEGYTVADLAGDKNYDPYNPIGGIAPNWLSVLGYESYFMSYDGDPNAPVWKGQWGQSTSGFANYEVEESGCIDSYNLALGGNINNVVFWGMDFDISYLNFTTHTMYQETLNDSYVPDDYFYTDYQGVQKSNSDLGLYNDYKVTGTGFNYKLGIIVKPIQELRIGFAFHTPTWYRLTESFYANTDFRYGDAGEIENKQFEQKETNGGFIGTNDVNLRTPWKIIASVAGVIANRFIVSADYEWANYGAMKFSDPYSYSWDAGGRYDSFSHTNNLMSQYYRSTNTLRLGAEFRVLPQFSVRAGYSFVSSPVTPAAADNRMGIETADTMPQYRFDDTTNYITAGLGYRYKKFYADLAYVYKHMKSTYHAFTPDPGSDIPSPQASLSFNNSQIVLSAGFKF